MMDTTPAFDDLGVFTLDDAHAMLTTVVTVIRRMWSPRITSKAGRIVVSDVALQACELRGARSQMAKLAMRHRSPPWRGNAGVAHWFRRVPSNREQLAALAKSLKLRQDRARRDSKRPGEDYTGSSAVVRAWAASQHGEVPSPISVVPGGVHRRCRCQACVATIAAGRCRYPCGAGLAAIVEHTRLRGPGHARRRRSGDVSS